MNILSFFIFALAINAFLILEAFNIPPYDNLIKLLLPGILLLAFFIITGRGMLESRNSRIVCGILLASVLLVLLGNIGFVRTFTPPYENSPAIEIIQELRKRPSENIQLWVFENGWPFQHMDFTYWDVANGIHPMRLYQSYYLKTVPSLIYTIGNTTYFSADYVIDTLYLENGEQNLPEYTFKVQNISVYKPDYILPNVFFIRDRPGLSFNG